jgi:Ca-activated chloride channel family protein
MTSKTTIMGIILLIFLATFAVSCGGASKSTAPGSKGFATMEAPGDESVNRSEAKDYQGFGGSSPSAPAPAQEQSSAPPSGSAASRYYDNSTAAEDDYSSQQGYTPNQKPYDLTFFETHGVNPFIPTSAERFSTFAMDVDTAAYTIARRFLNDGKMPDKNGIRTEEFINYFDLEYPDEEDYFSIVLEGAESEFGRPDYHMLMVGVKANELTKWRRKPANIVFVIDVSGSMSRENRLELVKRCVSKLSESIYPGDKLALATYNTQGRLLADLTTDQNKIYQAISNLYPSGSTNAHEGLQIGYGIAEKNYDPKKLNVVILMSDGVANTGVVDPDTILDYVMAETKKGITLTTIGVGMGNYNDVLLEKLSDSGDGKYYYVDTDAEADRLFTKGAKGLFANLASDAKIQVEFNPKTVQEYRLLGYENRMLNKEDFRNDYVDAGEVGEGQSVTALYEIRIREDAFPRKGEDIATVRIRYHNNETNNTDEKARKIRVSEVDRRFQNATPQFKFTASVAEFAEILKQSYWAQGSDYDHVIRVAQDAINPYPKLTEEREFVQLVSRARDIDRSRHDQYRGQYE